MAKKAAQRYDVYAIGDVMLEAALSTMDDLVEATISVYDRSLDRSTVKGLLKFYKSDTGKKYMSLNAVIDQELSAINMEWQTKVVEAARNLMLKEKVEKGINPNDYLPPLGI
jgi:hypothetical protein